MFDGDECVLDLGFESDQTQELLILKDERIVGIKANAAEEMNGKLRDI
jgi:hypothetical protein